MKNILRLTVCMTTLLCIQQLHSAINEPEMRQIATATQESLTAPFNFTNWATQFFAQYPETCGTDRGTQEYPQAFIPQSEFISTMNQFKTLLTMRLGLRAQEVLQCGGAKDALPGCGVLQKILVKQGDNLIIIGDLHASGHSLVRNLLRLIREGTLNDHLTLKDNTYLFITGDLASRGSFGSEVWYLAAKLALQNPEKVFIARGNHEWDWIFDDYGFKKELLSKYNDPQINNSFKTLFRLLPCALYVGYDNTWVQINHALVNLAKIPEIEDFITSNEKLQVIYDPFFIANYFGGQCREEGVNDLSNKLEAYYCTTYPLDIIKILLENSKIKAIFRGHDHNQTGICTCPKTVYIADERNELKSGTIYHLNHSPVYTLMSAPDGLASYAQNHVVEMARIKIAL